MSTLALARAVAQRGTGEAAAQCRAHVFPNVLTGKPFVSVYTSRYSARTKVGLVDVRGHDLRHRFASALLNQGMTLRDVRQLLGHANIATTQRDAHLSPGRLQTAVNAAGQFFNPTVRYTHPEVQLVLYYTSDSAYAEIWIAR